MKIAALMALMGLSMSGTEASQISTLIDTQADTEADIYVEKDAEEKKEKKKEDAKKLKHTSKTQGDNMDNGEDDENEKVPDVKVDDIKDSSIKPFFIVLQGKTLRKVFMSKEKLGIDRVAKIKEKPNPRNSVFIYDKRTRTIRLMSERNFAISNRQGKELKPGHKVVFRRVLDSHVTKDQRLTIAKQSIHNDKKNCIQVEGKSAEMASLQWWKCDKTKPLQHFKRVDRDANKAKPDFTKQRFTITLAGHGARNIYVSKEKSGDDSILKIIKKPNEWRSWFIMDKRTGSVRLFTQRHMAISNLAGKNVKQGKNLVLRKFSEEDKSQAIMFNGKRVQNKHSKRCISTLNEENKDNVAVTYWPCNGKETQKWTRIPITTPYESLCNDVIKEGKRYRECPGKKPEYLGEHCKRTVIEKNGNEKLVKKCGTKTWDIHSCHRYQQGGQWFRKCGASHLEKVKGDGHHHNKK